jgi:cytidylate kinase
VNAVSSPSTIAIDGPASSGKTTLGQLLAEELGYLYIDTGAMYRAVTLCVLRADIDPRDEAAVSRLAERVVLDVQPPTQSDGRRFTVLADGEDVTWEARSAEVDAHVSIVSLYKRVRDALTAQQRRIAERGRVVMVGRDIGTVVLPDADLKLYITASVEERARRRWLEFREQGLDDTYEEILASMRRRDRIDSGREIAPLRPADDAIIVDTTDMTVEQVMAHVRRLVKARSRQGRR